MVQAQVLQLLRSLQNDLGLAMLFITHDLSVLVDVSDRLAIMYAGKIVEEGKADEVFHAPEHPYTAALAAAFPEIGDARFRHHPAGLGGDPPDPQTHPDRVPVPPAMRASDRRVRDRRAGALGSGRRPASRVRARGRRPEPESVSP